MVTTDSKIQEIMDELEDKIRIARKLDRAYLSNSQTIQACNERTKMKAYMETLELLKTL